MSWEIGIIVLLAVVLIGGFVWYERSRPPSQLVALVAVLAALAVAGRIVLSPIPNVVPTTDIVLLAGYALGGAPGFAVGALTALVSNFWLGQGPWTPWQMAGWGMTGLLGAGLAAVTGRSMGRWSLAAVCAAAGFLYGALLDFSVMFTYGGEQSLDRYLALSARGLPFNIAHAAGNAVLALVAGPAFVRMLLRYRRRFEFAWGDRPSAPVRDRPAPGIALVLACLLAIASAVVAPEPAQAAKGPDAAVSWLKRAQNKDGGFGTDPGTPSSPVMTGWACLGLEAAGVNPLDLSKGGKTPIDFLRSDKGEIKSAGDLERTILVLEAAGLDSRKFAGRDLVAALRARRRGDGSWPGQVNPTAFGILALSAAGSRGGLSRSAAWLRGARNPDGGWGFAKGSASDPDSTGAALQALAAAGGGRATVSGGANWLRGAQVAGGGFAVSGGSANAQSTAWAVQGLVAAGTSPATVSSGGRSPFDYLRAVQAGDGHYRYSFATDQTKVWVTGQALVAAKQKAFPLAPVARAGGGRRAGQRTAAGGGPAASGSGSTGAAATEPAAPGGGAAAAGAEGGAGAGKQAAKEVAAGAAAAAPGTAAPVQQGTAPQPGAAPVQQAEIPEPSAEGDSDGGGVPWWVFVAVATAVTAAAVGAWLRRRQPQ
jgi:energy-coupling factor transport system substrate-specific component